MDPVLVVRIVFSVGMMLGIGAMIYVIWTTPQRVRQAEQEIREHAEKAWERWFVTQYGILPGDEERIGQLRRAFFAGWNSK